MGREQFGHGARLALFEHLNLFEEVVAVADPVVRHLSRDRSPVYDRPGLMKNLLVPMDRWRSSALLIALAFVLRCGAAEVRDHKTFAALAFAGLALFLAGGDVWPEVVLLAGILRALAHRL
jgi:hypothetical protein